MRMTNEEKLEQAKKLHGREFRCNFPSVLRTEQTFGLRRFPPELIQPKGKNA